MARAAQVKFEEYVSTLGKILDLSRENSFLWEEQRFLEQGLLKIAEEDIEHSGICNLCVQQVNGRFSFMGRNLLTFKQEANPRETSRALETWRSNELTPRKLLENFYDAIEEPLGKYLAKQRITSLNSRYGLTGS